MWFLFFIAACSKGTGADLPSEAIEAQTRLETALVDRVPGIVGPLAQQASVWEGQDSRLDRMIGDALANVLMSADDGLRLLRSNPAPGDRGWREAMRSAALRTGDPVVIRSVWAELGDPPAPFDNPVLGQVVQRMRANPSMGSAAALNGLFGCQLLDAQPAVGRKSMDHPIDQTMIEVALTLGADQVALGRPAYRSDPDPQTGRGLLRCEQKMLLSDGWPAPMPKTLTLAVRQGDRTAFIDIKHDKGQPWAYATTDLLIGDRLLRAWVAHNDGKPLTNRYPDGLWAKADRP